MPSDADRQMMFQVLIEAEKGLDAITKAGITELLAFRQPPSSVVSVCEALVVLLAPTKRMFDWSDIKKWLNSQSTSVNLIHMLMCFDRDKVTDEQLDRITMILSNHECDPERVRKSSLACYQLCVWLRAIVDYSTILRKYRQTEKTE